MLEALRAKNLDEIYQQAQKHLRIQTKKLLPLSELRKHVDYERLCNQGLHARYVAYPTNLMELALEEMLEIQQHCNDQVLKCYWVNKGRPWALLICKEQMYQVFQCYSEDQIFCYEQFEFALLERRIDELEDDTSLASCSFLTSPQKEARENLDDTRSVDTTNTASMRAYMKQKRLDNPSPFINPE